MYGFSIISYIEILYYLTGKWFVFYYRAYKSPKESSKANDLNKSLNWNELMPSGMEWYWRQELRQQPPEK